MNEWTEITGRYKMNECLRPTPYGVTGSSVSHYIMLLELHLYPGVHEHKLGGLPCGNAAGNV